MTTKQGVTRGCRLAAWVLSAAAVLLPLRAWASDWPLAQGDLWEITGVKLKNGGEFKYAQFIATQWKADQEFAKSKGWIKGYTVFANVYNRKGEPDIYLVIISERLPSGAESDKRNDEYNAWRKTTSAQMVKESGDRAEFREIESNLLWQEFKIK